MEQVFRLREFDIPISSSTALPLWSSSSQACGDRANFTFSRGGSTNRSACEYTPMGIVTCTDECWVGYLRHDFDTEECRIASAEAWLLYLGDVDSKHDPF